MMHGALPIETVEAVEARASHAMQRMLLVVVLTLLFAAPIAALTWWWSSRPPELVARYRAEALCFALAESPAFDPPMAVESGAAMVRGRFSEQTPASLAIRQTMRLREDMVLRESHRTVGDFDVSTLWLRLPEPGGSRHWLVVGWMEGSDLAMCSFRFAGDASELSEEESTAGDRLLGRILSPHHFRAGVTPVVRWRSPDGQPLPQFGPRHPA